MHAPHIHYANSGYILWVLGGKAHLVYIWLLAGPGRCSMCNFHHQKTHMGPTWGPYVLVLVGSGWEGPSGIHLVFIWATWDPYTCGFFVGRPIWYTSGFQLGEDNVRRAIFTTKNPHGAHMGPICVGSCGFWVGRPIWYTPGF